MTLLLITNLGFAWGAIIIVPPATCTKSFSSEISKSIPLDSTVAKFITLDSKILKEFIVDERDVCW
jgi:hypothetical protein